MIELGPRFVATVIRKGRPVAGPVALRVCRTARQSSELQDGVQFLGGALSGDTSSECGGFARDPAKVEDQARLLARTLNDARLEPYGTATGCNPVQVGSTPTGLSDTARPTAHAVPSSYEAVGGVCSVHGF